MKYDSKDFTWGFEIEWGDIDKSLKLPEHLGKWEYCETDIVNSLGDCAGIAADPLGINPKWGGEINVMPCKSIKEIVNNIKELYDFFIENGNTPSASFVSHGHIHIRVPNLKNDVEGLKNLISYIKCNQKDCIDLIYNWIDHPVMGKTARQVMKLDGGRMMPDWMCDNIIQHCNSFDDFIFLHKAGKDAKRLGRPFRYAINTYSMKHIDTIEFRFFRSTIDMSEIESCFLFVEQFMLSALNNGSSVCDIIENNSFNFPKFKYDHELYLGFEKTKWGKERGSKSRELINI